MFPFIYKTLTEVHYGDGVRTKIGEYLAGVGYHRALLLSADGMYQTRVYADVERSLEDAGLTVCAAPPIAQNPKLPAIREAIATCLWGGADCVVALGGGSAMDAAKMVGASVAEGEDPWEYLWGGRKPIVKSLPVITIPTISATGTEINNFAVVVDEVTRRKNWCETVFPVACFMDPEITATVPVRLAVWGAMDILSHTFEFYFNGCDSAHFQNNLSEAILKSTMGTIRQVVRDPGDRGARGELMWCAAMAWGGITKFGRGEADMACHSIEESFSGYFDTHHGACLGVLTPRWMRIASRTVAAPFARFARNIMGVKAADDAEAAREGIERYIRFLREIGAPDTYRDIGSGAFSEAELHRVAENAWEIYGGKIGRLHRFTFEEACALLLSGREPLAGRGSA